MDLPGWAQGLDCDHFDIAAKSEKTPNAEQSRQMVQALLAERFGLKFHREMRGLPVYSLVLGKNGTTAGLPSIDVSNVLSKEKRQQVIAPGSLGWGRRGTSSRKQAFVTSYLKAKAAGIAIPGPGGGDGGHRQTGQRGNCSGPARSAAESMGMCSDREVGVPNRL